MPLRIAVIDGQGGGIGAAIVKRLRDELHEGIGVIAREPLPHLVEGLSKRVKEMLR